MATGDTKSRTISFKRIVDPSDPDPSNPVSYCDVPCIVALRIVDGENPTQLIRTFDSGQTNMVRKTRVRTVKNATTPDGVAIVTDDTNKVDCERVIYAKHVNSDLTEWKYLIDSDPAPLPAPIDPAYDKTQGHRKSHVVRYNQANKNDPNETPWIDVELADEVKIIGNHDERDSDAAQVVFLTLSQDAGDKTFSDPTDPFNPTWADRDYYQTQNWDLVGLEPPDGKGAELIMAMDTSGNPDPVRLDPFQNIVNVDWGSGLAVEFYDRDT